jgi:hypothetical protein
LSDENAAPIEPETVAPQTIEQEVGSVAEKEKPTELPPPEPVDNADELDDSAEQSAEDFVTVERNGKTYQIPRDLEGELLMQSDYTKKTQTVAEKAKALESRETEINRLAEATEAELDARAQLRGIDSEIERFKTFDFAAFQQARQTDPMGADEAWAYKQHLANQKAELEGVIGKTRSERTEKAQQDLAKRVQETTAFAQKEIPGFKPELTDTLVKFAIDNGVPEDVLKANWSPVFYKLLHRAHLGDQAMKRQAAAPKAPPPAAPIAPLQTVTAKSQPAAKLSLAELAKQGRMEEYAAARKAGRVR